MTSIIGEKRAIISMNTEPKKVKIIPLLGKRVLAEVLPNASKREKIKPKKCCSLLELPNEILFLILSHVDKKTLQNSVVKTCKLMKDIVQSDYFNSSSNTV